jgi:tetratricopeptide (TPR) repeat protein
MTGCLSGRKNFRKGMDAMAKPRDWQRPSQLWQWPLLLISLGCFAVAAILFIHPTHTITFEDRISVARNYLAQNRPDAALEQLNRMLQKQTLAPIQEGVVHLILGEALEADQKQQKLSIPENYRRIIEQTQLALTQGATADAAVHRRLADSFAALDDTAAAIDHYRTVIMLDPERALDVRRKMIELLVEDQQTDPARQAVDEYLDQKELTAAERSWALTQKANLLIEQRQFDAARKLLADALRLSSDPTEQGQLNYQLGYCAFREGDEAAAERFLRLARDQMKPSHPMDGDAAYFLGRIYQDRNDPQTANSMYEVTLISHPDSKQAPLALLGRGTCRIMLNQLDEGLTDLHDLTAEISRKASRQSLRSAAIKGLREAEDALDNEDNFQAELEVIGYEEQLETPLPADFFARLGEAYENRAGQLDEAKPIGPAEQARQAQEIRDFRVRAGDAYVAESRALTLVDDKGYGDALWHGIDLYDAAGDMQRVIAALEIFAAERPSDKLAPDALLRLGRAYQAIGMFDKAVAVFQRNQFLYPNSLAASKSAVPLAEAYMARGTTDYPKAERVLLGVIEDNDLVDPGAEEFHQSLLELAKLYYHTQRYEEAIARLEEMVQRYPTDQQLPQLTFLMADSYRQSASLLNSGVASTAAPAEAVAEALTAKRQRLTQAEQLYDRVLDLYGTTPPQTEVDKLYQKLSTFFRADCTYDLGKYEDALKLYDQAAFRYQDDPSALAAYVQIVNCYCALGEFAEARTANERAKWILRRMPADAFKDGNLSMPKEYWDEWLKWASQTGVY